MDLSELADRVTTLVENSDLRRRMGEAGRRRAREVFDWSRVMARYHELWSALNERREAALRDHVEAAWIAKAPTVSPTGLDPFEAFEHYPTELIGPGTLLSLASDANVDAYAQRRPHALFGGLRLPDAVATAILQHLDGAPARVAEVAVAARIGTAPAIYVVGLLAKMGLIRLN